MPDIDYIAEAKSLAYSGQEPASLQAQLLVRAHLPFGDTLVRNLLCATRAAKAFASASSSLLFSAASVALIGLVPAVLEYERSGVIERQNEEYRRVMLGTASPAVTPLLPPQMLVPAPVAPAATAPSGDDQPFV